MIKDINLCRVAKDKKAKEETRKNYLFFFVMCLNVNIICVTIEETLNHIRIFLTLNHPKGIRKWYRE